MASNNAGEEESEWTQQDEDELNAEDARKHEDRTMARWGDE